MNFDCIRFGQKPGPRTLDRILHGFGASAAYHLHKPGILVILAIAAVRLALYINRAELDMRYCSTWKATFWGNPPTFRDGLQSTARHAHVCDVVPASYEENLS